MTRYLLCLLGAFSIAVACMARSPFTVHPAQLAIQKPCRFMGTVHKESRGRIEFLRACGSVSHDEWLCMARVLESLDAEFTARCTERSVPFRKIADAQRSRYLDCLGPSRADDVECAVLSGDPRCLTRRCS